MYDTGVTYLAYKYQISCYPIAIFGFCSLGGGSSDLSVANDFVSSIVLISLLWKAYFFPIVARTVNHHFLRRSCRISFTGGLKFVVLFLFFKRY